MNTLSPAAAAVLDAYMNNCGWLDGPLEKDYRCAAAVLRAVADVNVGTDYQNGKRVATILRSDILAIATELESQ